ncbi:hypothetical protein D9Q98_003424 [Chlorella vulgaris]|uniref:Uncharacterized protein n=1 Tax=Chlorella vulgaris TaxID=3077 RepID=A0A9D4TTZ3_CHLVU|nr:hypothetical protein D9Q98_003424 [Chlorella vulgaris]
MCSLQTATGAWKPCAPLVSQAGQGDVVIGIPTGEGSAGSPASVSDTPVIIAQNGSQCLLPLAYNGLTVETCVNIQGAFQCWGMETDDWEDCPQGFRHEKPKAGALGMDPAAATLYMLPSRPRQTTSGAACQLPVVDQGEILVDCVQRGGAWSCLTSPGNWEQCDLNSSPPPADEQGKLMVAQLSSNVTTPLTGLGFCAHPPIGGTFGAFQYFQAAKAPAPLAFFPLTEGSLQSMLVPAYGASLSGAPLPGWFDEPTFGRALNCSQEGRNAVLLDTVPYASNGSFAINLWMRRLPGSSYDGELHQYLYSHTGLEHATISGQVANKVQIYVPDRKHPAHGLIRTIVADSNDTGSVGAAPIYLDSDGSLNSEASNRTLEHSDVNDGGWHMVTVSTFPNGTRGYSVFVDGQQVASLSPATQLMNGSAPKVTGGDPARLTDAITLCARSDMDPARFFDGSLAHLTLFSHGLEPEAVAGLYATYRQNGTNASGVPLVTAAQGDPASSASPADGSSSGLTTGEIVGVVLAALGATMAVLTALVLVATHRRKRSAGKRFDRFQDEAPAGVEGGTVQDQFAYGGGRPAAVPMAAVTRPSIQLSSGRSLSLGSAGNNPEADAAAAEPRSLRPTLSDVSTTTPSNLGAQDLADEHDDATSMASVHSRMSDAVSVEPGRRSLVKRGSVRVVLPGVEEGEPRGPFDP